MLTNSNTPTQVENNLLKSTYIENLETIVTKPTIVACIPAYNEEKTIAKIVLQTKKYVDKVIVCDDGSTDMTAEIAEALGATVIKHRKNIGKGATLKTLINYVKQLNPDIVVTLDADGQHDPNEIPKLLEPIIKRKAEMVIGSRYVDGSWTDLPLYRKLGLKLLNFLSRRISKGVVKDTHSGFRAYSSSALDVILDCESQGYGIETEQLKIALSKGLRISEIPITIRYKNLENTSKKNPIKQGTDILATVLRLIVEEKPLIFLGVPGLLLTISGIMTGVYLLWYFNATRYFSIPIALITLGAVITGITLTIAALTLYALKRMKEKLMG